MSGAARRMAPAPANGWGWARRVLAVPTAAICLSRVFAGIPPDETFSFKEEIMLSALFLSTVFSLAAQTATEAPAPQEAAAPAATAPAGVQKWEYKVVDGSTIKRPMQLLGFSTAATDEPAFNDLGAQGWELVGVAPKAADIAGKPTGFNYYYFKRPVK
jgi:hypothetical protein